MVICTKCGNVLTADERICTKCGTIILASGTSGQGINSSAGTLGTVEGHPDQGWGEISQSHGAVIAAAVIILFNALLSIITSFSGDAGSPGLFIGSFIFDIILSINILRGKHWARTWMLIRAVLGFIIWFIVSLAMKDYASAIIQVGYFTSIILLLTGHTTRLRLWGSVALFIVLFLVTSF
jgi:hypothetical protein